MRKVALSVLFFLASLSIEAQVLDTLDFRSFLDWVRTYHPVAAQAEINLQMGAMEVRQARGGFDPLVYGNLDKKEFKESVYYDKREAGVAIPTWMGVELTGVYEQNSGQFLDPEASVPSDGLISAGASVNLARGLILDERRAALRQAQIYQESTEVQRIQFLNALFLDATDVYWRWALAQENVTVLDEGVELAQIRFEAVKSSFLAGSNAAIDTVEAFSILMNRQYKLQEAENIYFRTTQELNTFLWDEDTNPMTISDEVKPQGLFDSVFPPLDPPELRTMVSSHPDLQVADFELASLDVERKLKSQQLLPVVKFKYNFLTENMGDFNSPFFENNYKYGLTVYTPLFLRKSRGALGLAKAKIDFKQNSRDLKEIQLRTKLESELNNWKVLNNQVVTFSQSVESLEALLTGELRKFEIGESSLFLVNSREVSVYSSRLTLNQLIMKRKIAFAKARYAAGLGFE